MRRLQGSRRTLARFWIRLADDAEDLADMIGSNEPEAANMAYAIQSKMLAKAKAAGSTRTT